MSYDVKYRKCAIKYLASGHTYRKTAETFKISPTTLNRWVKKYRTTGSTPYAPAKKRRLRKIDT